MKTFSILTSVSIVLIYAIINHFFLYPRFAYVETGRLMVGFNEASRAERELKAENEKWQAQSKLLQDSVKVQMDRMTKEYDKASNARKRELQDLLAAANQRVNNFSQANMKRMDELNKEKTGGVVQKMNMYMREYGKKHNYNIIFATASGNIVYAKERQRLDITDEIIKGLNERYK